MPTLHSISAITLFTADMSRSLAFYRKAGFEMLHGSEDAPFTSLRVGEQYLNLCLRPAPVDGNWGRVIFYTRDVDAFYNHLRQQGLVAAFAPRDAPWGERYFHIRDPDGHELSFAWPLPSGVAPAENAP